MANVVIDPITRIEGHLRIEVEAENGVISKDKAWSVATQFRGIEEIVLGRDPRDVWAFTQRICGVCTTVHAIASVTAVENAIGSKIPRQAVLIRDLILHSQGVQDHVIHFYHLHALDWVNVVSAASADARKAVELATAIGSKWKYNTYDRFEQVRQTVAGIADSKQLSVFTGGYWEHPAYKLPPEVNLIAVSHYLDALEFQRSMIKVNTVFGGKNPHPNFLVGGMASTLDYDRSESINQVQVSEIQNWVNETLEFVENCYIPDALAILESYPEYFDIGASSPNYLAVGMHGAVYGGDPNQAPMYPSAMQTEVKPGVILNDDFTKVYDFDPLKVTESIASSWLTYSGGKTSLAPAEGETKVGDKKPKLPIEWLADSPEYSWAKAPRYDGHAVQVGPLARVILAYAQGHKRTKELVDMAIDKYKIQPAQLNSTAGRTLARAVECWISAEQMVDTMKEFTTNLSKGDITVFDASRWEPSTWPKDAQGYSFVEVARGNLSHWVKIDSGGKVSAYQCVVPTTWLAGGRDETGQIGPYEHSLAGNGRHPLERPEEPLEVLRTIHSFDPCMACAVQVLDVNGETLQVVTTS